ncbi:MAG: hypothetical protein ACXVEF_10330 [Polyangiales bacterium]
MHRRAFLVAYALWLFGIFAYFVPASTWSPVSRFGLTRAIVERGTFDVDPWSDASGDRAFRNGHWYTDKAPVPSFLAVPAYAISHAYDTSRGLSPQFVSISTPELPARHLQVNRTFARSLYVCSLFTAAVAGVAVALLSFEWLRRRASLSAAFVGSLAIALATPVLPYATSFYGHVVAGAFLLGAFHVLFAGDHRVAPLPDPSRRAIRIAGLLLVLAIGCEYVVAVPVAVICVAVLLRARAQGFRAVLQLAGDLALGGLAPAIAIGLYHTVCFGKPFATGYQFLPRVEFASGHAKGLMGILLPKPAALAGLLVGPRRGLWFVAPITAIGVVGTFARVRRGTLDERVAAAVFVALLLTNAGYYMWWGGAATGPRHLIPVVPFLALGVACAWDAFPRARAIVVLVSLVSFANMVALTAVGLEAPEHGNALFDYAWPRLFARQIAHLAGASNLGLRLGLPRHLSLAPLLVWIALGLRHLVRKLGELERPEPTS